MPPRLSGITNSTGNPAEQGRGVGKEPSLLLGQPVHDGRDRLAPVALVYLRVDDVRRTVERLRAEGVTVDTEPHIIFRDEQGTFGPAGHDEWMAFIRDSEGNQVGLASQNPPDDETAQA